MKNLKRILSIVLVMIMVLSFAGCHKKGEIAVKIGDVEFTSAYYMCALINADSEAKNKVYEGLSDEEKNSDKAIDYYSKKIEDKEYVQWVEDTAMDYLKEIAAYRTLCKDNKLELDEDMKNELNMYANYYWQSYAAYYELNGVGQQTYTDYMKDSYYSEIYFEHLYDEDGEKAVKAEDVKTKIYDSFVIANILEASFTSEMKDEEKKALKEQIDGYAKDLKDGKKTFEQVYNEYNKVEEEEEDDHEGHDHTSSATSSATSSVTSSSASSTTSSTTSSGTSSETKEEEEVKEPKDKYASVLGDEDTGYESEHYKTIKEMKTGEVKVIEVKDTGYVLVVKQDITADEYYLDSLDMTTRHLLKDDEFEKTIDDYAKKMTAEVNDYAVNQFKVKKIKEPEYAY